MKSIVGLSLMLTLAVGAFAQDVPQPAFRLLDGYLEKRSIAAEYGAKTGSWVLMGTGAALGAASATLWFAGDDIARSAGFTPMPQDNRLAVSVGLGVGAVVLAGIGFALKLDPPSFDERAQYAAIYRETDPVLQETLAAARLKGLSEMAQEGRTVTGIINLALSGTSLTLRALANNDQGLPWSDKLFTSWSWELGTLVSGTTSLLVRSPEEGLYQEYLYALASSKKN